MLNAGVLTFQEYMVSERLRADGANDAIMSIWRELVAQEITAEDEDAEF